MLLIPLREERLASVEPAAIALCLESLPASVSMRLVLVIEAQCSRLHPAIVPRLEDAFEQV